MVIAAWEVCGSLAEPDTKTRMARSSTEVASLTFDQYDQDQIVQIEGSHDSNGHFAGLTVFDRPDRSIEKDLQESPSIESMSPAEREKLRRSVPKTTITVRLASRWLAPTMAPPVSACAMHKGVRVS
jgi:hypothetical protein